MRQCFLKPRSCVPPLGPMRRGLRIGIHGMPPGPAPPSSPPAGPAPVVAQDAPPVFDCAAAGLILSVFAKCNKCPKINDLRHYCDSQQAFFNGFSTVFQAFGLLDWRLPPRFCESAARTSATRSEEHTSELQSLRHLVCRL